MSSLHALTRTLEPWLAPALASPAARAWLGTAAARLPGLTRLALECHLGSNGEGLDLCASVPRQEDVVRALAGALPEPLAAAWLDADSRLSGLCDTLLLELDQGGSEAAIFLGLRAGADGLDGQALPTLCALLDGEGEAVGALLRSCTQALASSGLTLTHVGRMRSRPGRPWRLNLALTERDTWPRLLAKLPLPRTLGTRATRLLGDLQPLVQHVVLALDVAGALLPRVGFECYPGAHPEESQRWACLLAWLERRGLCDARETEALLAWPGEAFDTSSVELPEHVARVGALAGPARKSITWRRLNHVKLVLDEHGGLRAKVYLAAGHGWR